VSAVSSRRLYFLLVGLAVACALAHAMSFDLVVEDAYITYRYAENAAHGLGLVFNPGEHVEGFTSLGWTLLLALVAKVGAPTPAVSPLLSIAAGLGVVVMTAELSALWRGGERDARAALPAFVVAAYSPLAYWSTSGMEGASFALVIAIGAWTVTRARASASWRAAAMAGAVLGASTILRPEGFGYACALGVAMIAAREGRWTRCGAYAGGYVVVVAPEVIWRWATFHRLLPNTYYAKASFSFSLLGRGASQLESFLTMQLGWLAIAALAWLVVKRRGAWMVPAVIVAAAMANLVIVGGDAFHLFRFLLPALPAMAVALVAGVEVLAERFASARREVVVIAGVVVFGGWLVLASFLPMRTLSWRDGASPRAHLRDIEKIDDDYFLVGEWLRRSMPPGTWIAVNAVGIVPYVSRLSAIDMLGLVDDHIAHSPIRLGSGAIGHEKHDGAYVLSRRPAIILLGLPTLLQRPIAPDQLDAWMAQWLPFLPGDGEIYFDEGFRRDYEPVCAKVGDRGYVVLFARRDAFPHSP
jgi:hypothetical protein